MDQKPRAEKPYGGVGSSLALRSDGPARGENPQKPIARHDDSTEGRGAELEPHAPL